ncbi:MAG: hypothetical protein WD960_10985 [Gemmatimonadota bacterium]
MRPEALSPARPDLACKLALGILVVVHVLGALGAPVAASLHIWDPGATPHQDFHVVWEAFKYFTASIFAVGLVLGPLREGRRWAFWLLLAGSLALFGGVFVAHALSGGGPMIDFVSYGSFLVLSLLALAVLRIRLPGLADDHRHA